MLQAPLRIVVRRAGGFGLAGARLRALGGDAPLRRPFADARLPEATRTGARRFGLAASSDSSQAIGSSP